MKKIFIVIIAAILFLSCIGGENKIANVVNQVINKEGKIQEESRPRSECLSYFDGCNQCSGNTCTQAYCAPEEYGDFKCYEWKKKNGEEVCLNYDGKINNELNLCLFGVNSISIESLYNMYTYQTAGSFTRFTKYEKHELQEIYNTYDFMKYKIPLFKDDETIEYIQEDILFDLKEHK